MSHTVIIKTELRDPYALTLACQRLGWQMESNQTVKLYSSTETGMVVHIPGWTYPAVVQSDGSVKADTYNGAWGDERLLEKLTQIYGVEKSRIELQKQGMSCYETVNNDGSITLTATVGGY